jgi:hypothetical protein
MKTNPIKPSIFRLLALAGLALIFTLNSCTFSLQNIIGLGGTSTPAVPAGPTSTPIPAASVTFTVTLPSPLLSGEVLNLSVLDEITGLGLNPLNYPMQGMDALHYTANIPFAIHSVVKYRYVRQGTLPTLETTSTNSPVRYRMVVVTGPDSVEDVVSSWADGTFNSPFGRISGQILEASSSSPLPDILIAAAGQQTLTDSNGKFNIENVPAGTHNLVAFSLNGEFQALQQGAHVEVGRDTEANLSLKSADPVDVTFIVTVPPKTISNVPVRLAGSYYQAGNTFGDLFGGLSNVASLLPLLTPMPDGRYSATLKLRAGMDFRYKYTLGDGFWNAEHNPDGSFIVRQLIVPQTNSTYEVHDVISTWQAGAASPILFEVSAPSKTPVSDILSIQFNPYGWTEPIQMWPRGNNQWVYELYSPLNMLGDFEYRYCRNDQCGVADDVQTRPGQLGRPVSTSLAPEDLQDTINNWTWFTPSSPAAQVGLPVNTRSNGFWAGVEFLPMDDLSWQPWMGLAIQNIQSLSSNWLVLSPTWTVSRTSPLVFSQVPGVDPLWSDNNSLVSLGRASNMNVALFPQVNLPADMDTWWKTAPRTTDWWNSWYNRYIEFVDYQADLASKSNAQALILGGDWVLPALPGGVLSDGSASNVPADVESRWASVLVHVRKHFSGTILWAVTYDGKMRPIPDIAKSLDGLYLLWHTPLSSSGPEDLYSSAGQLLDDEIKPLQASLGKPVIIAAAYSSSSGSSSVSTSLDAVLQPGNSQLVVDLKAQADIYQALMRAVNDRSWIGGFVSRGYYPPVALQDASASIHGKPAADVLWYWYPRMLGIVH